MQIAYSLMTRQSPWWLARFSKLHAHAIFILSVLASANAFVLIGLNLPYLLWQAVFYKVTSHLATVDKFTSLDLPMESPIPRDTQK